MDTHREEPLLRVAQAISDGVPVDWDKESSDHQDLRPKLGRLRLLEAVATAHRSPVGQAQGAPSQAEPGGAAAAAPESQAEYSGASPPETPSQWGPLKILEKIGGGRFGEVYRAHDPALQREVALKLLLPETPGNARGTATFLAEARRLARVRHPNVLVVHGADRHGGRVGLWTDLLEGKTLERCLTEQGPFSEDEAALIGIDVCRALAAVHAAGLIHRDVKTLNVMREKGGRIVLMDFGSGTDLSAAQRTAAGGQVAGTPLTMAPEILLRGEAPRPTADIYSLGVLLYRLVSGRFPIQAESLSELYDKHKSGASVPLLDVRHDLKRPFVQVVERALSPEPGQRYASAGAMERALAASVSGAAPEIAARPPEPASRLPFWLRAAASAAVVLLLVVAGIAAFRQSAKAALAVEASLFRATESAQERLLDGARIHPADSLFLEFTGSELLHVYVLNEDESGEPPFVLFPAGLDLGNPLPPQILHRLPGRSAGIQYYWEVSSAGGKETILIIASRQPLKELEREIERFPRAEPGRPIAYPQLSREAQSQVLRLRGIGGMGPAPSPAPEGSPRRLSELAKLLPEQEEAVSDVWIRQIRLENPGPS